MNLTQRDGDKTLTFRTNSEALHPAKYGVVLETKHHTLTITIYNRDEVYDSVGELLHNYADKILLRVGYPVPDQNTSIIFIIAKMSNDEVGALSGKLGQISSVKVKSTTLKI